MDIRKDFFHYVIPSMLAFALSGIYAIADGFFVGNALGDSALAAVNIGYPLTAFLQAVGTGIGMGGAVEYSISVGTGEIRRGRQYFGMSILILLAASGLLTLFFLFGAASILQLFGASGEILSLSREYVRYIAYGAFFQILGTGLVPFIRNMGGAVTAMAAMIAGFLTNIALDYLLVWVLSFGMMGAAIATVIGQAVTFFVCLPFFVIKKQVPLFRFGEHRHHMFRMVLKIGLSPFGLTFSPNITLILINKSAAVVGGAAAVTCYAPISYISAIVVLLLQGISDGSQPLFSLHHGSGKPEIAKQVRKLAYHFALLVGAVCMAVLFLLRGRIALLFGASPEITKQVGNILPFFLSGYLFICISRVTTAYFYATSKNLWAYLLIYGEPLCLAFLLIFLPQLLGLSGTWMSPSLSQLFAMGLSLLFIHLEERISASTASFSW